MKEFTKEKILEIFEDTFKEKPEDQKINSLIELFGITIVSGTFGYFLCNGVRPPAEGKRNNPYGLIYKICYEKEKEEKNK
jgi:hypothetical protein